MIETLLRRQSLAECKKWDSPLASAPLKASFACAACFSFVYVTQAMPSERPERSNLMRWGQAATEARREIDEEGERQRMDV